MQNITCCRHPQRMSREMMPKFQNIQQYMDCCDSNYYLQVPSEWIPPQPPDRAAVYIDTTKPCNIACCCNRYPENEQDNENIAVCPGTTEKEKLFISYDPREVQSVELLRSKLNRTGFFERRNGIQDDKFLPDREKRWRRLYQF